ncbi:MAG TPA: hypothetical protein VFN23_18445 [Ktedonobacteraceae bacterium]|nr:hypothetical protein [Ktedonobacteraceae bacterium]
MRITSMVLRIAGVLALIFGLLSWFGVDAIPIGIHMLLGLIVVISLWVMAFFAFRIPGGMGLAIGAIVLGILVLALGLTQTSLLPGSAHWVIQVIHLLFGLGAIGMGEMISGRARRTQSIVA